MMKEGGVEGGGRINLRRMDVFSWFSWFLVLLHVLVPVQTVIRFQGDVNIGVLVDLHEKGSDQQCGQINVESVQQMLAAKWALEVINNQSLPHELRIGLGIQDACSQPLEKDFLIDLVEGGPGLNHLIGLIGIGSTDEVVSAGSALNPLHIPVVAVDPDIYVQAGDMSLSNLLTTAPDLGGQARALAHIGYELTARKIALIASSAQSVTSFLAESTTLGIRVPEILELVPKQINIGPAVEGFLRSISRPNPVVAVILEPADVVAIAEHLMHVDLPSKPTWLIGSLGLELQRLQSWRKVFSGGGFVEPHLPELREFKDYFLSSLQNPDPELSEVLEEYMAESTGCIPGVSRKPGVSSVSRKPGSVYGVSRKSFLSPGNEVVSSEMKGGKGVSCSDIPLAEMELRYQQDPKVSFVVKAVSALTAGFRLVQLASCGHDRLPSCLRTVRPGLHEDILKNLHKLSFTSMSGGGEMEGTRQHFTKSGRLVANKQILYIINYQEGIIPVGWYSEDDGLNVKENIFDKSDDSTDSTDSTVGLTAPRSSPLVTKPGDRSQHSRAIEDAIEESVVPKEVSTKDSAVHLPSFQDFIGRGWSLAVLSVCLLGILMSLWMLVYVNFKLCDRTLSGNQSMGLLLLLGNTVVFGCCVPWILPPSYTICAIRYFLHPLALCLCFGLLLMKVMQLRSLVSVGIGGKIPQVNQLLSLFFIVMVQVVINSEWFIINMPLTTTSTLGYPHCAVPKETFLLLHIYPALLLILVFLYSISVFRIKRNYNEGRWVLCATSLIIPIFLAWGLVYYYAGQEYEDAAVSVALVLIGLVILATVFLPKMHTIVQQSKFRKLKLKTGSESTMYTTYSEYPGMFYPMPGYAPPYTGNPNKYIINPPVYSYRFNGLNYLTHPTTAAAASWVDWSRDHSPGLYHSSQLSQHPHHMRRTTNKSSNRKSKSPVLAATLQKPMKRSPKQCISKSSKLSGKSYKDGLLLCTNGLESPYYDDNARVYHVTP